MITTPVTTTQLELQFDYNQKMKMLITECLFTIQAKVGESLNKRFSPEDAVIYDTFGSLHTIIKNRQN